MRTTMPAPAMKPIIEVAVKNACKHPVRRQNADERKRNHHHHNQRREERPEPADHQNVNQHQHGGERQAEVAEHFDRDVPFAVPFHRGCWSVNGRMAVVNFQRRAVAAEFARVEFRQRLVHFQNRIHRAFHHARHVADDVSDRHEIFVVNALVGDGVFDRDQFAQRHERRGTAGG